MTGGIRGLLAVREALEKQIMYAVFYLVNFISFFTKDENFPLSTLLDLFSLQEGEGRGGGSCKYAPS